jgi:hypothetical protein
MRVVIPAELVPSQAGSQSAGRIFRPIVGIKNMVLLRKPVLKQLFKRVEQWGIYTGTL